jgi:hypothetical protein
MSINILAIGVGVVVVAAVVALVVHLLGRGKDDRRED